MFRKILSDYSKIDVKERYEKTLKNLDQIIFESSYLILQKLDLTDIHNKYYNEYVYSSKGEFLLSENHQNLPLYIANIRLNITNASS